MRTLTKSLLAVGGGALALWTSWGLYVTRSTERVPYESVASFEDVEIRRYPRTILVETTAESTNEAFRRLFRYISGANEASEAVSMTAPVASDAPGGEGQNVSMTAPVRTDRTGGRTGDEVSMTAPVRTSDEDDDVTMSFYLPADYTPATAPMPTDSRVRLVVQPPQTLAVTSFSWYATDGRVSKYRSTLLDTLAEHDVGLRGEPYLLQYNDPYTPPFMRRNEVAVEVDYRGERPQVEIKIDDE